MSYTVKFIRVQTTSSLAQEKMEIEINNFLDTLNQSKKVYNVTLELVGNDLIGVILYDN